MGIGDHHHWHASSYVDHWIDGATGHDEQRRPRLHQAARLLPFAAEAPVRVLDLGGGYGEFSAQVLDLFPRASVCLADYSVPMLERAKQRLVRSGDRVEFRLCDLRDPVWTTQVDARFASATSALGELYARGAPSHHLGPDTEEHHHELQSNVVVPTLEDHLCWLREAGFVEVDCVWKQFSEVFLCGFRSS